MMMISSDSMDITSPGLGAVAGQADDITKGRVDFIEKAYQEVKGSGDNTNEIGDDIVADKDYQFTTDEYMNTISEDKYLEALQKLAQPNDDENPLHPVEIKAINAISSQYVKMRKVTDILQEELGFNGE